jgi:hypothetical protein
MPATRIPTRQSHPSTLDTENARLCIDCRHHVIGPEDAHGNVDFCTRSISVINGNPQQVACSAMRHPCIDGCRIEGRYFEPSADKVPHDFTEQQGPKAEGDGE